MKRKVLPGKRTRVFNRGSQGAVERIHAYNRMDSAVTTVGKVIAVHMDRRTVDVQSNTFMKIINVPVIGNGGLSADEEVWGTLELPSVGTYVVIQFIHGSEGSPIVIGTYFPWAYSKYQSDQVPVNSDDKQFTKKLLEDVDEKTYRRIFKSGTTLEVSDDGTLVIETPSGRYVQINEAESEILIEDPDGNKVTINSDGILLEDANGNDITMGSSSVTVNGNLEVLQ